MTNILIIDDREEHRKILEALLIARGYTVQVAQNGAEALVMARQSPPALAITDIPMPVMDGYTM